MTAVAEPPRLPRTVPDWHASGACNLFPELDFIEARGPAALAARVICRACPVRLQCATDALERGEPWGIWGGLDRKDRKAVALELGYPVPAVLPEHGTNSRYAKHGCRCRECAEAHAIYEFDRRIRARKAARDRNIWTSPAELVQPLKVGRHVLGPGQLVLPLPGLPPLPATEATAERPALRLVA